VFAAAAPEVKLTPGGKWPVHSMDRPRPRVVDPGTAVPADPPATAPSDAVMLFDGTDLSGWEGRAQGKPTEAKWTLVDGAMEVAKGAGTITTKARFGSCQLHLEWQPPAQVMGRGQSPGNSGVFLTGFPELQVLNSYQNDTYPDGQAGALYGQYPPLVNASRKPGEWQCYDIIMQLAKLEDGKVVRPARLTVLHNGVLVHHALEFGNRNQEVTLSLQDHGTPLRYRNIWYRPLGEYDEVAAP
jgi:hypothetical protein